MKIQSFMVYCKNCVGDTGGNILIIVVSNKASFYFHETKRLSTKINLAGFLRLLEITTFSSFQVCHQFTTR